MIKFWQFIKQAINFAHKLVMTVWRVSYMLRNRKSNCITRTLAHFYS